MVTKSYLGSISKATVLANLYLWYLLHGEGKELFFYS